MMQKRFVHHLVCASISYLYPHISFMSVMVLSVCYCLFLCHSFVTRVSYCLQKSAWWLGIYERKLSFLPSATPFLKVCLILNTVGHRRSCNIFLQIFIGVRGNISVCCKGKAAIAAVRRLAGWGSRGWIMAGDYKRAFGNPGSTSLLSLFLRGEEFCCWLKGRISKDP